MIDFLSGRPAQLLAETLFHFLWQGAAVGLILLLIDPLLRSVGNKYAASLGALILMLVLPAATCYLLAQREPGQVDARPHVQTTSGITTVSAQPAVPQAALAQWQPLLVGLWLTGVSLLAARLLIGYIATLWIRGDRRPLPAQLAHKVAWLGRRLGVTTRCRVFLSTRITEAIAVGCFKPLVLIPLAWASELPPSALEAVIAHELAHVRRWDLWVTLLQRLAETTLFYHPAVWWLSRRLSLQRELCCDALAVSATRSPVDYVLALETIARRTSAPPLTLATAFLGGGKMNLLDRVRHVLAGSTREAAPWWPTGLAMLAAPLLAAVAFGGWSLLPSAVVADEERVDSREVQAEEEAEATPEMIETALSILLTNFEDEDGDEAAESEEAALERKLDAARQRKAELAAELELRSAEEAVAREVRRAEKHKEEVLAKKRSPKQSDDDFDLSDFRPETDREAKLMAVIKKLQSQVKGEPSGKIKKVSGASKKKGAPDSKESSAFNEFQKVFNKKLGADDEALQQAIREKDAAIAKEREAKERAAQEHKRALSEKEAILAKERQVNERAAKEEKHKKDVDARDKEAYLRALKEKEAMVRKQKQAATAANEAEYGELKDAKPSADRKVKRGDDEVEALRRALREREAELKKLHEALERAQKDAPEKNAPDRKDSDRKDAEEQAHKDAKAIDKYILERLEGFELRPRNDGSAAE